MQLGVGLTDPAPILQAQPPLGVPPTAGFALRRGGERGALVARNWLVVVGQRGERSIDDVRVLANQTVLTPRLEVRLPVESDRESFVELFCDERFMVFSAGVLNSDSAHRRFDEMLERATELPFAKQPVIERRTGSIIGYSGVNSFEFEEQRRLEYGYRLVPEARGKGYATEASRALLTLAEETFAGEILAMIDPRNTPSQNVARKLGFVFWKQAVMDGVLDNLYQLEIGEGDRLVR
jgi:RimJ/RimL family protein N-acetyltransferase